MEAVRRWRPSVWVLAGILAAYSLLTYQRSHAWSSATALWTDSVAGSPGKQRPRFQLAHAYYAEGRCADAAREYGRAAELGPSDDRLLLNWALALECAGRAAEALVQIEQALQQSDTAHARATQGMIYAKMGRLEEALAALDLAEKRDPRFSMLYVYRGHILLSRGEAARAREQYRRALEADPASAAAAEALRALGAR
jgi:tetratricopeptide (TPR) repeat protein